MMFNIRIFMVSKLLLLLLLLVHIYIRRVIVISIYHTMELSVKIHSPSLNFHFLVHCHRIKHSRAQTS